MKTILTIFCLGCLSLSAQTVQQDSIQAPTTASSIEVAKSNSIIRTSKTDSALIELSEALTRLGVSVNNLAEKAGSGLEKGFDQLDKNLKEETLFIQIKKALDKANKSLENAADKLQRKIDDSVSKQHKE